MILTVLADNRTVSFAFFDEGQEKATPLSTFCIAALPARTADEYATLLDMMAARGHFHGVNTAIIASVVPPLTSALCRAVHLLYGEIPTLTVGAGLRSGLTLRTDAPADLGADLVAMAVGAATLQKPPFLVLHCGDVTTLSAVDAGKDAPVYLGCAILPGAALCAKTLKEEAALLSTVALAKPPHAIGKNTGDSVRAGVLVGHAAAIDRLIADFEAEMGKKDLPVIATGEEAELVLPLLSRAVIKEEALAHKGLYHLALLNVKKGKKAP